jgi:hypothetical protein
LATPGIISSGLLANGIAFFTGISQLAANAAAAVLKPRYLRKSLLGAAASKKDLPSSASKGSSSLNSSLPAFWYASELFKFAETLPILIVTHIS